MPKYFAGSRSPLRLGHPFFAALFIGDTRLGDVNIRQIRETLLDFFHQMRECRFRVCHPHLVLVPPVNPNGSPVCPDLLRNGFQKFHTEPLAVLWASTILIPALIRHVLEELVNEVSIRRMYLYPVEPSEVHGLLSSFDEEGDVLVDLGDVELAGT